MNEIQKIYIALFGRPADPAGLQFFATATNNGANLTAIGDLASTAEYQSRFVGQDSASIITAIYNSLYNRNPEVVGLNFFLGELSSGRQTINSIAINIAQGAQGDDLETLNNKIVAANAFTTAINTPDELAGYRGDASAAQGRLFLTGITADDATIPSASATDAALAAAVAASGPQAAEFILTPGDDFADSSSAFRNGPTNPIESSFRFTSANEIVTGSNATVTAVDILTDSSNADADRFNVSVNGANNLVAVGAPTVTNLETLSVTLSNASGTANLTKYTGLESVVVSGTIFNTPGGGDNAAFTNFANSGVTSFDTSAVSATAEPTTDFVIINDSTANQNITFKGGAATEFVTLGDGNNTINTGAGISVVTVGNGNNNITGGALADLITAGNGNNTIKAGDGVNQIIVGSGDNSITGGSGVDQIAIANGGGRNTISAGGGGDNVFLTATHTGETSFTLASTDTGLTAGTFDTIDNFRTTIDTIDFTNVAAGTATNYAETLGSGLLVNDTATANAAFTAFVGILNYVYVFNAAGSFLFVDSDASGTADGVVALTGVTAAAGDFDFSDIV